MQKWLAAAWVAAVPFGAHAGFDEGTGDVVLDAAASIGFEDPAELSALGVQIRSAQGGIVGIQSLADQFSTDAIEGSQTFGLGGEAAALILPMAQFADRFRGRRIEMRVWIRSAGGAAFGGLQWEGGRESAGAAALQPTGRMTDDGWEEWAVGPVDFHMAHRRDPGAFAIWDRDRLTGWGYYGAPASRRLWLDGLEIVDLGPAVVPDAACRPGDAAVCGDLGTCRFGRCVDAETQAPPLPRDPRLRQMYLDRWRFLVERFEGGRGPRKKLGEVIDVFRELASSTPSLRGRQAFERVLYGLEDGHLRPPMAGGGAPGTPYACLYLGDADLLDGHDTLPMVLELTRAGRERLGLMIGDVLVAIDGEAPLEWAARFPRRLSYGGDAAGRDFVIAPNLIRTATDLGAELLFRRCDRGDGIACSAEEWTEIRVDLAQEAEATIWRDGRDPWSVAGSDVLACDYRFRRPVEGQNVQDPRFSGYADDDGIRSVLINAVPGTRGWRNALRAAWTTPPDHVLIDQRLGGGGTLEGVEELVVPLLAAGDYAYAMMLPPADRHDPALLDAFLQCTNNGDQCGAIQWRPGLAANIDVGPHTTQRVAVLNGNDVSGNDYSSMMLRLRSGPTRIFGPGPTQGAFGVIWRLPGMLGEHQGGSIQTQDTLFIEVEGAYSDEFVTGTGVAPDEVVRQRQSDALAGIDSVLARARAWLQEEGE